MNSKTDSKTEAVIRKARTPGVGVRGLDPAERNLLFRAPVGVLDISARTRDTLRRQKIYSVGSVLTRRVDDLAGITALGKKGTGEILCALRKLGVTFRLSDFRFVAMEDKDKARQRESGDTSPSTASPRRGVRV